MANGLRKMIGCDCDQGRPESITVEFFDLGACDCWVSDARLDDVKRMMVEFGRLYRKAGKNIDEVRPLLS